MTITAWINSSSFPVDDAAVVSQFQHGFGYQLDTTVDKGPRTLGFKLTNACGDLMARYGGTPLALGTWYHVAGVYDASRRMLDVYINGKMDNGALVGSVTSAQHSSRGPVYLGTRSDFKGFGFAGSIREARIYSFALTNAQITADMRGAPVHGAAADQPNESSTDASGAGLGIKQNPRCAVISEDGDHVVPLMASSLGVLVAAAGIGLAGGEANLLFCAFLSLAAGLSLLPAIAPNLPSFNLWLIPLITLAGGIVVIVSAQHD